MVARGRIELPTQGFSILCSTTELPRHLRKEQKDFREKQKFVKKIRMFFYLKSREILNIKNKIFTFVLR